MARKNRTKRMGRGKVLVVEAKNGKITNKYITQKEAQKHMSERHERFDRYAPKKSTLFKFQTQSQSGGKSRKYRKSKRLQMMGG
jgi:hypothetical protein